MSEISKIELLTAAERLWLSRQEYTSAKALRIIDQLTAALEDAERDAQRQKDLGTYEVSLRERRLRTAAESRAETLAARVAELQVDRNEWMQQHENLLAIYQSTVAGLATAKAKTAELEEQLSRTDEAGVANTREWRAAESELARMRERVELAELLLGVSDSATSRMVREALRDPR